MAREQPIELFMPPNMLKAKVGGGLGGIDLSAIRRAEAAMEEMRSEFAGWAGADIEKLAAARSRFAEEPGARTRGALLRAAHDLKGQAATFNYPLVARVAASLSKLVGETADGAVPPLPLVDAHVSAIQAIFRDKATDGPGKMALALAGELEARVGEALGKKR